MQAEKPFRGIVAALFSSLPRCILESRCLSGSLIMRGAKDYSIFPHIQLLSRHHYLTSSRSRLPRRGAHERAVTPPADAMMRERESSRRFGVCPRGAISTACRARNSNLLIVLPRFSGTVTHTAQDPSQLRNNTRPGLHYVRRSLCARSRAIVMQLRCIRPRTVGRSRAPRRNNLLANGNAAARPTYYIRAVRERAGARPRS